ncbi:abortive infection family protein [Sulfitobacter sp. BSw21498]|uniref:abortive infection family protein n=1 Tax=Sulfitobacter sp. BSw21498 TaxID=664426 RepID=UPI00111072B7|nr:abortive infection family protein [Sulfitobacter sp. BSw21498]
MKIGSKAIEFLVGIISGDSQVSEYRSGPQLVNFFNGHGEMDLYGAGFPSRHIFVREKLLAMNGQHRLKDVIEEAFNALDEDENHAENIAFQFSKILAQDGYKLNKDYRPGFYDGNDHVPGPIFFQVVPNKLVFGNSPTKLLLTHPILEERVTKARARIESNDFDGAITICYTVIEGFLKLSLEKQGVEFKDTEGDIKKLYKALAIASNMDQSSTTEDSLRPLLNGLSTLVTGFYEIANKSGDRHVARHKPVRRHAVLVVNLTFAFCDFLIDSFSERQIRN